MKCVSRGKLLAAMAWGLVAAGCSPDADSGAGDTAPAGADEPGDAQAAQLADGRAIVERQCSGCHATGVTGKSPRSDAPPLRHVLADYAPEALAQDFREGIHVGHPDMPDFDFNPRGTDAVLAYLVSIQAAPGRE